MEILIADADDSWRGLLETTVRQWSYQPIVVSDGAAACSVLSGPNAPPLAILDRDLPHCDGPTLCRQARALDNARPLYALVLTSRSDRVDVIAGLQAGVDDYLSKPFDHDELYARLTMGSRVVQLQQSLADKVRQLEDVMASVKHLQGLLPMCCYCKCIRDDQNYWRQVEHYLADHSEARFSHGICPKCFKEVVEPEIQAAHKRKAARKDDKVTR